MLRVNADIRPRARSRRTRPADPKWRAQSPKIFQKIFSQPRPRAMRTSASSASSYSVQLGVMRCTSSFGRSRGASSVSIGYALWALQLACFVRLQLGDPGSVSASWEARAAAGEEATVVCVRSGRLVPTRARYCRRANTVVLGLDHCADDARPSALAIASSLCSLSDTRPRFCGMGFVHSLLELGWGAPTRLGLASLSRAMRPEIAAPAASALDFAAKLRRAFSRLRLIWCSCGSWLVQLLAASPPQITCHT